jgi:hypothetical protein
VSKFVLTAQLQLQAPSNVSQVVNQIQKQLSGVNVNINAQGAAQAQKQVNQLSSSLGSAANNANKLGKNFGSAIRRFSASAIAYKAISLFTSTLSSAIDESIAFERELIKIAQVTGRTAEQLGFLTQAVSNLSTGLGVSSGSLLSVSRILSQAGFSAEETKTALDTLAKTQLAPTFDDIAQTAEGAIAIFNQFGAGAAALEEQLGAINAVAGQFAVEAGDLISVVRRTGGVFRSAGGELNELIALFTSVRSTTRESAESIATGLRTIFTRIQRPKTIEFLKQYGVELTDLEGKFVGPYEAVRRLSGALAGLEQGDITFVQIAEELGGFRQIGKVIPLLQQFSVAQAALNTAQQGSGSLARDAATAQLSLAIQITKVKEEFLDLIRGVTATPTFQIMAKTALTLASALIKVADALKPILPIMTAMAAIKFTQGIGGFLGGIAGGLKGGKGFNAGGKVHAFATGGIVPGTGNRDTVPAMLTPGEFVIRKSSVQKLGAGNLAKMNTGGEVKGYKGGGKIPLKDSVGMLVKSVGDEDPQDTTGRATLKSIKRGTPSIKEFQKAAAKAGQRYTFEVPIDVAQFTESEEFDRIAKTPIEKSLNTAAQKLKVDPTSANSKINTAVGQLFEDYVNKTAGVVSPGNKNFDLVKQQKRINPYVLENIKDFTDIKLNNNEINASTLAKKAVNEGLFDRHAKIRTTKINKELESSNKKKRRKKYATGGEVQRFAKGSTGLGVQPRNKMGMTQAQVTAAAERKKLREQQQSRSGGTLQLKPGTVGGVFLQKGSGGTQGISIPLRGQQLPPSFPQEATSIKGSITTSLLKPQAGDQLRQQIEPNIANAVQQAAANTIKSLELPPLDIDESSAAKKAVGKIDLTSIEGYIFEAFTSALTGLKLSDAGATFDYVNPSGRARGRIGDIFSKPMPTESLIDAKRTLSSESVQSGKSSIAKKVLAAIMGGSLSPSNFQKFATGGTVGGSGANLSVARFASGGSVGTDTVPALLTPGEFVVNRKSAQRIGYGSLNRMNKVGKYAKGGVVQHFAGGGTAQSGGGGIMGLDAMTQGLLGASMALQMLTPTIDENSSAMARMAAGGLESISMLTNLALTAQTVSLMLKSEMAGNLLKSFKNLSTSFKNTKFGQGMANSGNTFGDRRQAIKAARDSNPFANMSGGMGKSARKTALSGVRSQRQGVSRALGRGFGRAMSGTTKNFPMFNKSIKGATRLFSSLGGGVTRIAGLLTKFAGPIGVAITAFTVIGGIVKGFRDLENRLNKAVEKGDVGEAQNLAVSKAAEDSFGGVAGGVASLFGVEEELVSFASLLGGQSVAAIKTDIASRIQSAKTAKALAEAQKVSTEAMEDLKNGTINASEALARVSTKTQEAKTNQEVASKAIEANAAGKSTVGNGAIARNILTLGGMFGETSGQRNARIDAENKKRSEDAMKQRGQAFDIESKMAMTTARSVFASGGSMADAKAQLTNTPESLAQEAIDKRKQAMAAAKSGDTETAEIFEAEAKQLSEQAKQLEKSLANLQKEVEKQQKYFAAMNLGLNSAVGAAGAFSTAMSNYAAAQEAGNVNVMRNFETLKAGITSAATGMDPKVFQSALKQTSEVLGSFGADTKQLDKFENNLTAINKAQANAEAGLNTFQQTLRDDAKKGLGGMNDKEKFEGLFDTIVEGSGLGADMQKQLKDLLGGVDIDYTKIAEGDFSQIEEVFEKLGLETLEQAKKVVEAEQQYQKAIVDATQKRVAAEEALVAGIRQKFDYQKESQEIIASAGGPEFTAQAQRQMAVDRYNAANPAGKKLEGATAADITKQQKVLQQQQASIQETRLQAARGDADAQKKLAGPQGVELQNKETGLQQQNQELYNTTKQLIDIKRQEVKIIQEKNRLEQKSMESLLAGDIDSFFEAQSSQSAIDALASGGNVADFDADTLYSAFEELKRQAAAGVTEVNGQQLQGPGGLLERAAAATAEARGLDPQQAAMVAQKAVGQTPAEQAANNEIQALASTLPAFGDMAINSAQQQILAAEAQKEAALIQKEAAVAQARSNSGRSLPPPAGTSPPAPLPPGAVTPPPRAGAPAPPAPGARAAAPPDPRAGAAVPPPPTAGGMPPPTFGATAAAAGTTAQLTSDEIAAAFAKAPPLDFTPTMPQNAAAQAAQPAGAAPAGAGAGMPALIAAAMANSSAISPQAAAQAVQPAQQQGGDMLSKILREAAATTTLGYVDSNADVRRKQAEQAAMAPTAPAEQPPVAQQASGGILGTGIARSVASVATAGLVSSNRELTTQGDGSQAQTSGSGGAFGFLGDQIGRIGDLGRDVTSVATGGYVDSSTERAQKQAQENPLASTFEKSISSQAESASSMSAAATSLLAASQILQQVPRNVGGTIARSPTPADTQSAGSSAGFDSSTMSEFTNALNKFNDTILQSISTLQATKFTIQLEPTNININLTGTSFLQSLTTELKGNLLQLVSDKIRNLKVDSSGRVVESYSNL